MYACASDGLRGAALDAEEVVLHHAALVGPQNDSTSAGVPSGR